VLSVGLQILVYSQNSICALVAVTRLWITATYW